jgi:hypothetical protein
MAFSSGPIYTGRAKARAAQNDSAVVILIANGVEAVLL